uniref:Tc1-like transposase DDE domain-containing protein n=1 Tax=Oncorhynchus mykiss TaxID=8022 RepID=A0A8K9WSF2_ONCMY
MKTWYTKKAFLLTLKNTKRKMRERALGMLQGGMRTADVARAINCNFRPVRHLRQRYRETGRTADHPRSGRPRVTTPAKDQYIRTSHLRDKYRMETTARVTPGTHNPSISAQTLSLLRTEAGLRSCRPVARQVLTKHHRQQRHLWPQTHRRWTRQDWQKVLFTDESRFCLTRGDGRIRVYRRRNVRCTEACTLERDRFGGEGSVMFWGAVSQHLRTELVVIAGNLNTVHYRENILLPHVVPFMQAHPDMKLQHDNATSHTAHSVRDFLQDRKVSVLPWPAKSPELNSIEHVWDLLDRRVRARSIPPRNVQELAGALVEEWGNISQQELANLVQSMRRRTAVLNAAGGHTEY